MGLPGLDTIVLLGGNLGGDWRWPGLEWRLGLFDVAVVSSAKLDVADLFEMLSRAKKLGLDSD